MSDKLQNAFTVKFNWLFIATPTQGPASAGSLLLALVYLLRKARRGIVGEVAGSE